MNPGRRLAAGLLAVALAGCGGVVSGCGGGSHSAKQSAEAAQAPVQAGATPTTTAPKPKPKPDKALIKLRRSLEKTLRKSGPGTGIAVYDLTKHKFLFTLRERTRRPPASVEKLYTTLALLNRLGPDATLKTRVLSTGHLGPRGVWHGDLYLKGGGDPTLGDAVFNRTWLLGYGPTAAQLMTQLAALGIHRVKGLVIGDESLFDTRRAGPETNFAPDLPDFGGELSALTYDHGSTVGGAHSPAAFAAHQLAITMRKAHIFAKAAPDAGRAPRRARMLASVESPPMSVLLRLTDVPSDDLFAEMLTKQLGARFTHHGSIEAGSHVIARTIARAYHLHPTIVDGSGLSRNDASSPLDVVDLLRRAWHTPEGNQLVASLPTVGVSGTTRRIAAGTVAAGRCLAKTGTLDGVTNLAGYCHARGHQGIAFALFVDGPPNWIALPLIGQMVAAIADY